MGLGDGRQRHGRRRGQASLEAALVLPVWLLAALGIVQLTEIQQARFALDAAAFDAARAGTVWSGDPQRMASAARFALLPTAGATFDASSLADTFVRVEGVDARLRATGVFSDGRVRVELLAPTRADFPKNAQGEVAPELEFDGPIGPAGPLELRVRVRLLYELRTPFASTALFLAYFAIRAERLLSFPLVGPSVPHEELGDEARSVLSDEGLPEVSRSELLELWELAHSGLGDEGRPRYFLPLSATYCLRLQSNLYRRFLP